MLNKNKYSFIYFLIFFSLIVGSFWVFYFWPEYNDLIQGDAADYYEIGQNIYQFQKFEITHEGQRIPTMSRPPLFPLIISAFYPFFGNNTPYAVIIFQILLLAGIAVLVYLIAEIIFNKKIARIASLATALFPAIGSLTNRLITEITFIFLLLLGTFFFVNLFKNEKIKGALGAGIFFGLATLIRPVPFMLPLFIIFFILIYQKFRITNLFKKSLILLFVFYLVISPWIIRNYIVFNEANISDISGLTFYNHAYIINYSSPQEIKHFILMNLFGSYLAKKIDNSYDYNFSKFEPHTYRRSKDFPENFGPEWPTGLTQHEERTKLFNEAKSIILKNPVKYISLSFLGFFEIHRPLLIRFDDKNLFAGTHPEIPDYIKISIVVFIKIAYLLFFLTVFYGIIISLKKNKLTLPILIIVLYIILLLCPMGAIGRYALPLYPFYFMFSSFAILNLLKNIHRD